MEGKWWEGDSFALAVYFIRYISEVGQAVSNGSRQVDLPRSNCIMSLDTAQREKDAGISIILSLLSRNGVVRYCWKPISDFFNPFDFLALEAYKG